MLAVVLGTTIAVSTAGNFSYKPVKSDAPVVMTINGSDVKADEYATYMLYNMKYYENMYAQYGMTDIWTDPQAAEMLGAQMPEAAKQQALYMNLVLKKFNEEGLKLTAAQQEDLKNVRKQMIESAGGEQGYKDMLASFGFTEQTYDNFMYVSTCFEALSEHYFGENGTMGASDDEKVQFLNENYIGAKHILILTVDSATGEQKRTDEQALAEAQAVRDRLAAGEDFDTVMKEKSEDGGLATNPDGYIFTEGEMVDEFYQAAKELGEDAVSEPVKSDFGYHIIKRIPVDFTAKLNESVAGASHTYSDLANAGLGKTMEALLEQWMGEADVQTTELFDTINHSNVYDYALVEKPAENTAPAEEPAPAAE